MNSNGFLLADPATIIIANALQLRHDREHYESIKDGFEGWTPLHTWHGQAVEMLESPGQENDPYLIFFTPGVSLGVKAWGRYLEILIEHAQASTFKIPNHATFMLRDYTINEMKNLVKYLEFQIAGKKAASY